MVVKHVFEFPSVYGLKQAPRAWYQLVTSVLLDFGFTKCVSDPYIFFYKRGEDMVMVGVYVDDILISGNNRALIDEVKGYIEFHFNGASLCSTSEMFSKNGASGLQSLTKGSTVMTPNGCLRRSVQMISRSNGDRDFASEVSSKR